MEETLALKYRPKRFEDFIGQKATRLPLQKMCQEDKVPSAMLFAGVRGSGKTSSGRVVAAALNCESDPAQSLPCTVCASCVAIQNGTSLDVIEKDGASSGLVDDIRKLVDMLRYSVGGRYRVVLLDEAQSMSQAAFNALLKTLEEPPPNTVFILLTTEPDRILPTILSRCHLFEFRKISKLDIMERLNYVVEQEDIIVSPELISLIADRADGGLRDALMSLDQCARVGIKETDDFLDMLGEPDFTPALVHQMIAGDRAGVFEALEAQLSRYGDVSVVQNGLIKLFRDVLVLQGGGTVVWQGQSLEARQRLAESLTSAKVVQAMRVLWEAQTKFKTVTNPRMIMDLLMVMLTEVLMVNRQAALEPERKRMTLADLQRQ